ncbi:uncharacterized protein TNIN_384481, partial [Trichonephila inaurata madagascariensis]
MSSILQTLKKPYDCVLRFYSSSKTQKDISTSQRPNVFNSILSPFETYVVSLQSLLIWERPYLKRRSICYSQYFLLVDLPPPEGEDTESWTTVNPEVLSVPELSQYMNDFLDKMIILWKDVWKLRKDNRGL